MTKKEKQYCVLSAIYRMLRQKRITPDNAENLLISRAKYKPDMAKRIKELWLTSYPIKRAWSD